MAYLGQETTDGAYTLPVEVFPPQVTTVPVSPPQPEMMPIPTSLPVACVAADGSTYTIPMGPCPPIDGTGGAAGLGAGWIGLAAVAGLLIVLRPQRRKKRKKE